MMDSVTFRDNMCRLTNSDNFRESTRIDNITIRDESDVGIWDGEPSYAMKEHPNVLFSS